MHQPNLATAGCPCNDELLDYLDRSASLALALLTDDGLIGYANAAMRQLIEPAGAQAPPESYFAAPSIAELRAATPLVANLVYVGWMTFGGPGRPHCSLRGEVRRSGDGLLVLAEYDVAELTQINRQISGLNSEVTNLQRELRRKNDGLQQALAELRQTQMQLVHAEKMNALGQLTAGVAHEINNPIAFVNSNMHSLSRSLAELLDAYGQLEALLAAGDEAQQAAARAIRKQADLDFLQEDLADLLASSTDGLDRVKKIVEDLRVFSRLDEAECKVADLAESLRSTLAIARPELKNRVAVSLDIEGLPPIRCYPAELNQVFLNLIVNAAQAIDGEGTITITGRDAGDWLVLVFHDSGRGMPPAVLARCFDPFYTTKPVGSGTGLGLSLAYKIVVDRHHGSLSVASQPGQGTTFTITLPKELQP